MSKARELSKLPNYVLSTVAELKLSVGKEQGDKAFVGGYYADGDGGGGDFYWDAVSVEADNSGTIIQVTGTTTGRWKRIYSGSVNVKWFGAILDGITDDTVAISKARELVKSIGGEVKIGGVLGGAGTDLRALSNEYILGDGTTYKTDLTSQHPLIHSYIFNGTPTVGAGYAHYGTRLDYQTKPLVDVQSSVGFASMMQSYSTNTLGALLGNNTNQVAGIFNASAMDAFSSAGVEAINAIVYSGYTGAEPQSVIGIEVDLTVTNPAGFFNEAGKAFAVGVSSNLTGAQDGSIGMSTGQSSGLTNGWLYGGLFAGCKNVGIAVARQYVTPNVGIWVSAATTYGMYIGAKSLHGINSVNTPAYDSLHNPVIGIALGQRAALSGESNKLRLVDTNGSGVEHTIDIYADSSNDLQIEFDGVRKLTIAPNGNLYIANTQILSTRVTGYTSMSGTANKATAYDTSSITLIQLAERVKSLQDSLSAHGIIGA